MQQIKIKDIQLPSWSFKNVEAETFKSLEQSIIKNGQTKNIIVRQLSNGKYEVIDGRHVFKILQQTDKDYVWCKVYRKVNRKQAMLLYLEHDIHFENNFVEIAKALKIITKKTPIVEIEQFTRYNYKEVKELLMLANYDFSKFAVKKDKSQHKFF